MAETVKHSTTMVDLWCLCWLCPLTSGQLNDVVGMYIRTRALLTLTVHVDDTRQLRQGAQKQSIWPHWKPCITLKLIA